MPDGRLREKLVYIVYKHTNLVNGKIYIGITCKPLMRRWTAGYRGNGHFFSAIQKYGKENFSHEILAEGLTESAACEMERRLIKELDATNPEVGYNLDLGGKTAGVHSPGTIQKIRESNKGRVFTEEHKKKISTANKGRKCTPEQCEQRRLNALGNKNTLGRHPSAETRKKMSISHKGKNVTAVRCINDGTLYKSINEAAEHYGLKRHCVTNICRGQTKRIRNSDLIFEYA